MSNKTVLMMSRERWIEASDKFFHNFDESLPQEKRREMLFEVDDILKSLKLKYWLTHGTALGFVREGEFIQWDDDLDIDLYSEDLAPRFNELLLFLADADYVCRFEFRDGGNTSKISAFKNNFKISLGAVYLDGEYRRSKFCTFPKRFYEDSVICELGGREFNVPGPTDEYLSFIYKTWKTPQKDGDGSGDIYNVTNPFITL